MSFVVVTAPAEEPITLSEAKAHLRVDDSSSDALITSLIVAAREYAEKYTNRALITQTLRAYYDSFYDQNPDGVLRLPRPVLQSVTSVKYIDTNGTEQTVSSSLYKVDVASVPARVVPVFGEVWPSARYEINAVYVEYVAGYGLADVVPQDIKQAMFLHIGHMFENREQTTPVAISEVPMAYLALMSTYRVWGF